jgi:hypothetical protein
VPSNAAARVALAACAVAALVRVPGAVRDARAESRRPDGVAGAIPTLRGLPEGLTELLTRVRATVPAHEPVRLVVNGTTCVALPLNAGAGATFWIQYHLLPRPLTCGDAAWVLYVGGTPAPPDGAEVVVVRPTLVLARVR